MSKKEVATIDKQADLTKLDNFSSLEEMKQWATAIIDSGVLPNSITEPETVITIVTHGKELGLSPMIALHNIHVISGRPTLNSTMLGALLKRNGIEWTWDNDYDLVEDKDGKQEIAPDGNPNRRTTIKFRWKSIVSDEVIGDDFSVTWAQFCLSGLVEKDNWVRMPKEINLINYI